MSQKWSDQKQEDRNKQKMEWIKNEMSWKWNDYTDGLKKYVGTLLHRSRAQEKAGEGKLAFKSSAFFAF